VPGFEPGNGGIKIHSNIGTALQQVGREAVAQRVQRHGKWQLFGAASLFSAAAE
jgi:hypothetical protein